MPSALRLATIIALVFAVMQLSAFAQTSFVVGQTGTFYCATSATRNLSLGSCINSAIPYVFIALLVSFTLVAIAYLIGEVLAIQSFKGWYKAELWEAIKSLIIVGVIFSAIVIAGTLSTLLPGPANLLQCFPGLSTTTNGLDLVYYNAYATFGLSYSPLWAAGIPFCSGSLEEVNDSYNVLFGVATSSELVKNTQLATYGTVPIPPIPIFETVGAIDLGTTFNMYQSDIIDSNVITGASSLIGLIISYLVTPMLLVILAQYYLFPTIIALSLGVLLPLGLIFRATPFLRAIGATLIALAITGAVIYPMLLALVNAPLAYFFSQELFPQFTYASGPVVAPVCPTDLELLLCPILAEYSVSYLYGTSIAYTAGLYGGLSAFVGGNVFYILNPTFSYLFPVIVQFILFVLDLVIGIVAAQNIARSLGGELKLGVGKLKLT